MDDMKTANTKVICSKFLSRYKREGANVSLEELLKIAKRATAMAEKNFTKLKKPISCPKQIYVAIWVKYSLDRDLAIRAAKPPIQLDNPPADFTDSAKYFLQLPYELHRPLARELFNAKPEDRESVWKSFNLLYEEIEKRFIEMTLERIRFARNKGYASYVEMFLDKYKIPKSAYERFLKYEEKLFDYCNRQLPRTGPLPIWFYSEFNLPCYICRISPFPFKTEDEVLDFVAKTYAILEKSKHKINIKPGEDSTMSYKKETDRFTITIDKKGNTRHRLGDLLHELSHCVVFLENASKGINPHEIGAYQREKQTLRIELALLKKISKPLYLATFGEFLKVFQRLLFETELYKNPKQDLAKLYAKTFNRCFKGASQKRNRIYFLDERISLRPMSTLPHAVAQSELILKLIG